MRLLTSKLLWIFVIGAFALGFWYSRRGATNENDGTGLVSKGDLVQRVTIGGIITPNRKTIIAAPYNGYVRKIYVQVGQQVKPGDPIVSVAQSLTGSGEDIFP